ncbi:hypothetical protein [Sinorhizobium sp. A49]|uniref:hypothetical protein n=1 Tax=Sinorhizobium sp. A49 TaxID=1945861 RepID=UPI0011157F16|nr:hypothetical protein [Sinorhizobium sp. A49]
MSSVSGKCVAAFNGGCPLGAMAADSKRRTAAPEIFAQNAAWSSKTIRDLKAIEISVSSIAVGYA